MSVNKREYMHSAICRPTCSWKLVRGAIQLFHLTCTTNVIKSLKMCTKSESVQSQVGEFVSDTVGVTLQAESGTLVCAYYIHDQVFTYINW